MQQLGLCCLPLGLGLGLHLFLQFCTLFFPSSSNNSAVAAAALASILFFLFCCSLASFVFWEFPSFEIAMVGDDGLLVVYMNHNIMAIDFGIFSY
jgi:hypothetical protein